MIRILLVRHGQSEWNAIGRWQGWADPPLSELGREQSRLAGATLAGTTLANGAGVDAVMTSDLQRAADTAAILADALGGRAVEVDPLLRERDVGEWTGLTRADIEQRWPGALSAPVPEPPGGERPDHLVSRVLAALARLVRIYPDGTVLVVTHGGVIRGLERHLGVVPEPVPNLGGSWLEITPGGMAAGPRLVLVDPDDVPVTVPRQL